jgi:hypothetical protein
MFAISRTRWQTRPLSPRAKRRSSVAPGSLRKKDHHGMGISGHLAADLAEMMVHPGGIADRHVCRHRLSPKHGTLAY